MSGAMSADAPRMNSTLKMLLPTTLPTAMSALPASADDTLTAISGELVPNATMVRPMTSGEMPMPAASSRSAFHQRLRADNEQHKTNHEQYKCQCIHIISPA